MNKKIDIVLSNYCTVKTSKTQQPSCSISKKMHIKKLFELKSRKQFENLTVFVELKRKKPNRLQFSKRYQETKTFGGYSR
jgi:hypothetical protein